MPISFGTSTTLIVLPLRSGAPAAVPPLYGMDLAAAGVASQESGFVGRSSPPVQAEAARAATLEPSMSPKARDRRSMWFLLGARP